MFDKWYGTANSLMAFLLLLKILTPHMSMHILCKSDWKFSYKKLRFNLLTSQKWCGSHSTCWDIYGNRENHISRAIINKNHHHSFTFRMNAFTLFTLLTDFNVGKIIHLLLIMLEVLDEIKRCFWVGEFLWLIKFI